MGVKVQAVKPRFISMAELSCSRLMALIFDNVPGSKDRLMDILKKDAPAPDYNICEGKHHAMCTPTYGCIAERRLLLPTPWAVWIGEAEASMGMRIGVTETSESLQA